MSCDRQQNKGFWEKQVPVREFMYLCVILGLLTVGACSYFLSDNAKAASHLNFAATLISIILAVIAIIITLVDVAGQKHNVMQLSDSVSALDDSIKEIKNLVTKSAEQYANVSSLKDELISKITENDEWRKSLLEKLDTMSQTEGNGQGEEHKQLLEQIDQLKSELESEQLCRSQLKHNKVKCRIVVELLGEVTSGKEVFDVMRKDLPAFYHYTIPLKNEPFKKGDIMEIVMHVSSDQAWRLNSLNQDLQGREYSFFRIKHVSL